MSWAPIRLIYGLAPAVLLAWTVIELGGVRPIQFYPAFVGLALLFVIGAFTGLRVGVLHCLMLAPLVPLALNGSYPLEVLQFVALWMAIMVGAHARQMGGSGVGWMIYGLLLVGIGETLLGLYQSLGRFAGQAIPTVPMGTIYNRNHFAGFLEMLVPVFFMIGFARLYQEHRVKGFRPHGRRRDERSNRIAQAGLFLLAGGLLFLAILFSLSRGGTVAALAGVSMGGALLILNLQRRKTRERSFTKVLALNLAVLVTLGAFWIGMEPVIERFELVAPSAVDRAGIWKVPSQIIAEHPWVGVGAGMHGWVFKHHQDRNPETFYDYAHNDYLQAAAEWGIPAAVVFFGVIFFLVFRAGKACVAATDPTRMGLLAGGVGGVVALLVHSFSDFNLYIPSNAMLFGLILGATDQLSRTTEVEVLVPKGLRVAGRRSQVLSWAALADGPVVFAIGELSCT